MDPFRDTSGVPSDDRTKYGNNIRPHLPLPQWGLFPSVLSPPEETLHPHKYNSSLRYHQEPGHAVPSNARLNHPLTPPRQDDEEQQLRQWYAQHTAQTPLEQRRPSIPSGQGYATPGYGGSGLQDTLPHTRPHAPSTDRDVNRGVEPSLGIGDTHRVYNSPLDVPPLPRSDYVSAWSSNGNHGPRPMSQQSYRFTEFPNQHLPPYSSSARHQDVRGFQVQRLPVQLQAPLPTRNDPRMRMQQQNEQRALPPMGIFRPPPSRSNHKQPPSQPPHTQHRPANDTTDRPSSNATPPRQNPHPTRTGPSPGHDGVTPPDKRLQDKKEAYRKKAEELRLSRQAAKAAKAVLDGPILVPAGVKRKLRDPSTDMFSQTPPPPRRRTKVPGYQLSQPQDLSRANNDAFQHISTFQPDYTKHSNAPRLQIGTSRCYEMMKAEPMVHNHPVQPIMSKLDQDELPQQITDDYSDYRWSVKLYEIDPHGQYDYAQSWLEDLFTTNLQSDTYSWDAHTTSGFIKNGNRLSFLVLHNAADPFARGLTESTTSIGVYGLYWYNHDEIHWKTFTPGLGWLLDWCVAQNGISVKQKWSFDMPKASDRRFHRAYWLAANRLHLKQLLNHSESLVDKPHDVPDEDPDDEFEVEEGDLTNEWDVGVVESEEAWRMVLATNEVNGDEGRDGYLHVVTGSSGWEARF